VLAWTAHAQAGRVEIQREVGNVAGIATYVLAGELAHDEVLVGTLLKPSYPHPLRHSAPPLWYRLGAGALDIASAHRRRGDAIAALANLTQAVLATAQGRLAALGQWALNEKGIIERAGLVDALDIVRDADLDAAAHRLEQLLALPPWR
jgi:hypothetical protein